MHGRGHLKLSSGDRFYGTFISGAAEGVGLLYSAKGWIYKGTFENNKATDYGVLLVGSDFNIRASFFENISDKLSLEQTTMGTRMDFRKKTNIYDQNNSKNNSYKLTDQEFSTNSDSKYKLYTYTKIKDPNILNNDNYDIRMQPGAVCYHGRFRQGRMNGFGNLILGRTIYSGIFQDNAISS